MTAGLPVTQATLDVAVEAGITATEAAARAMFADQASRWHQRVSWEQTTETHRNHWRTLARAGLAAAEAARDNCPDCGRVPAYTASNDDSTWSGCNAGHTWTVPILAAGHTHLLAQAHAAGTAEGAAGERERIVSYIDGKRDRIGFSESVDKGIRWALATIRMMPVGWQPKVTGACRHDAHADCRLVTCICACHVARAGTSGAGR